MTMQRTWFLLLVIIFSNGLFADNNQLLEKLDSAIENRAQFMAEKENRISRLKKNLGATEDIAERLEIIDQLYDEYRVYCFDSMVTYAKMGLRQAQEYNDLHYIQLFTIHRAEVLAIGGLYSEAVANLGMLDMQSMDRQMSFKYYMTRRKLYSCWSQDSQDTLSAGQYRREALDNLQTAMIYLDKNNPFYDYYQGEYHVYVEPDSMKARRHFQDVLWRAAPDSRVYAMASYALADNYLNVDKDEQMYEEHLIRAGLADVRSCTMEAMAMQKLAIWLLEKDDSEVERAERYINVAMEDAIFYNNRLRIKEIAQELPQVMAAYQTMYGKQNRWLIFSVIFFLLLTVVLLSYTYYIYRRSRRLTSRQKTQDKNSPQLANLNRQLVDSQQLQLRLNGQLQELNQRLADQGKRYERLTRIYIDLCIKYKGISSPRISEDDAATFLTRFDKTFLELYPSFVDEFNALLRPGEQLPQKSPDTLTTELRTFALIRLGVKNTADIAGLLFLSNQTIYNCRSVTRNKAVNKETFNDDVMHLCST